MTELENIGKLAATASELLDAIRGGEIANMKAEHVQVLEDFDTAYKKAISDFGTEKTQKLNEFNNQKTSALNDLANRANAVIAKVESELSAYVNKQSHIRVTKNQALLPNEGGSFPLGWSSGYIKRATKLETVKSGVMPDQRSELAQEFLNAINSNRQYFAGSFDIWEIEINPYRIKDGQKADSFFMYQFLRRSQTLTIAAVVKHISGAVPTGFYCSGLEANQPAKLCGTSIGVSTNRNHYTHIHPMVKGTDKAENETTVIQIALPAAVTGFVDLTHGAWGQFPYIGDQAFD